MSHHLSYDVVGSVPSKRAADRFALQLPVELNGVLGLTRNISATGVYFESKADVVPGSAVKFIVDVDVQGEKLKMVCKGEVVRVVHDNDVRGIAVKLGNSFFTPFE
jgi:hypothetical protein